MIDILRDFLKLESASGILLVIAATLAMIAENSPASSLYGALLSTPVVVQVGQLVLAKPLLLWINDGLMAVFFLLIGLEVKREVLEGSLSKPENVVLPVAGAIGGIVVPAGIYAYINWGDSVALQGWAIPTATDIAFALGVLGLLGKRVPTTLKMFLLTLAIVDDIGAIIIIAIFYTVNLSLASMLIATAAIAVLAFLNYKKVTSLAFYITFGVILWIAVLKSGVHATLAGVVLAMFIPLRVKEEGRKYSPLEQLEHDLHPAVAYAIIPIFAFANAGVSLDGVGVNAFLDTVPLGIVLGLFVGKQIGVFGFSWLAVKMGIAKLGEGVTWSRLYGVSVLCGIGFTMSLFIGSLAFEQGADYNFSDRLGILTGSLLSMIMGYFILRATLPKEPQD